jgi:transglutaminase-like putative cysteine protease
MTILSLLRAGVLTCVLCALAANGIAEQQAPLAAAFTLAATLGWWITEWRAGRGGATWKGLPRWVTNALLLVIVVFAVFNAFASRSMVTTFATLLASVLVLKLWQERRGGDYGQLLTMSLFLTVASVLTDNSVATGLVVLVQTPAIAASAMLYQVWQAGDRAGARRTHAEERAAWKRVRAGLAATFALTLLAGLAVAVPVFVVMPRGYLLPQFQAFSRPSVGRTVGFTDQIDLSAGQPEERSTVVVMEAALRSQDGARAIGSTDAPAYLRGAVLDDYRSGRWRTSPAQPGEVRAGRQVSVERSMGSMDGIAFVPTQTIVKPRVRVPSSSQAFSVGRGYRWEFGGTVDWTLDMRTGTVTFSSDAVDDAYTVWSADVPVRGEEPERGGVTFPEERVRAYAERLLRAEGVEPDPLLREPEEDAHAARLFEAHLRTTFAYTLDAGASPIEQPVSWFLETAKSGHCEYFASALAALCRSVGIDANVVAGYLATEFDQGGGTDGMGAYIVRASDAHAWVEVHTLPGVWRTFDATPEANPGYRSSQRSAWATALDRIVWAIEDVWNARIVSYDRTSQEQLLSVQDRAGGLAGVITSTLDGASHRRGSATAARVLRAAPLVIAVAMLGVVVVGAARWVWSKRRRSQCGAGWATKGHAEAERLHREVMRTLASRGVVRTPGEPLRPAIARVEGEAGAALRDAAALLYDACFAGRSDPGAMASAQRRLRHAR